MNWLLCFFALFLSSCDQKPQATQYKEIVVQTTQAVAQVPQTVPADQGASADPHAGLDMSAMGLPPGMNAAPNNMFTWNTPQDWKQVAAGGMRLATFHLLADEKSIDCSIVFLGGVAGGLEANLRRWMGQLGVKATDDELTSLIASATNIKIKSGQDGKVFDFTTIQSRSQSTDKSMIAVMVTLDEGTLFVKMSGTVDTVSKNKDGFFKLVGSVEYHAPSTDATAPVANMPPAAGMNPSTDPHAGLGVDMSAMGGVIEAPTSQKFLAWTKPDGWIEEPGKHMRMASFHMSRDPKAIDCYIIGLAGPAGGLEANLQRWLGQLGLDVTDANVNQLIISAQTVTTKDGLEAKVFDFTGLQANASPTANTMMAAMITIDKTTVFVKMTGSFASVKENRDNYLKLLGSIARK